MKMLVESLKRMYKKGHSHRGTDRRACHKRKYFSGGNMNTSREKNIPVVRQNDTAWK